MLIDEETGQIIGARLRAEVAGIDIPADLIGRIRRRGRRTTAVRGGIVAAGAAVLASAGLSLAVMSGSAAPSGAVPSGAASARGVAGSHPHQVMAAPGRSIELDGYQVKLPTGLPVRKVGAGYLVGSHVTGYFTIFLERGKNLGPKLATAHGLTVHHVRVGLRSAWWVGTSRGGELWVQIPGLPATEFLVAKVLGAGEAAALRFATGLAVTHMPVVRVSCSANCG